MTATMCSIVFLAQSAIGCGWGGHHEPAVVVCSDIRGGEAVEVMALIQTLQCHPKWRARDDAAHDLREYDWRRHPAILPALTTAMLSDPDKHVRKEAAQALTKIDPPPCVPEVHAALDRAARCDSSLFTRSQARHALKRLDRHCVEPCSLCGPAPILGPGSTEVIVSPPAFAPGAGPLMAPEAGSRWDSPPSTLVVPEPRFESDGLQPLPPPLPPGAVESFGPLPEARRTIDDRITARPTADRDLERVASRSDADRDRREVREPEPERRRIFPLSILGRRGR